MKKILAIPLLISMILTISCEKDENQSGFHTTYKPAYPDRIYLEANKKGDSSVVLSWTKLLADDFLSYSILRRPGSDSGDLNTGFSIKTFSEQNKLSYVDKNLPLASHVRYQVLGYTDEKLVYSNLIIIERENVHTIDISNIKDVLIDTEENYLYIMDEGDYGYNSKILKYNYADHKTEKTINITYDFGYGDLGIYNSNKELYIASDSYSNGAIYIYNANDLSLKEEFFHGEYQAYSVAYNNGQIYLGVGSNNSVNSYSREDFSYIDGLGEFYDVSRIKIIPGTTTELFAIEEYDEVGYYSFDQNGNGISYTEEYNYSVGNDVIFEIAPDGSYFINGENGHIFNKSLQQTSNIGDEYYQTFAISEDGDKIYAANNYNFKIEVYNASDLNNITKENEYVTGGYPNKIFTDGSTIISISRVEQDGYSSTYAIEKIYTNQK